MPIPTSLATRRVRQRLSRVLSATVLCGAVGLGACDGTTAEPAPVLTSLAVQLTSTNVQVNSTTAATAIGTDQNGSAIATGTVTWSSSATAVATVDASGLVTAVGPGTAVIAAAAGGVTGDATLTVTQPPPVLASVTVTLVAASLEQGDVTTATAGGLDQYGAAFPPGPITWASTDESVATVDSTGVVTGLAPGTTQIRATASTYGQVGSQPMIVAAAPAIRVNEVESNGGTPGDWVELFNPTDAAVDLGGWAFKDDNDTRDFRIAAGTSIPAGGYLVLEADTFGFGLGANDAARLFSRFDVPVDAYAWTSHAMTTYGRCPNGSGPFNNMTTVTKGTENDCRPQVKVNEVESSGGTPGDWIELYNAGTTPVDLSGYFVKDNNDARTATLPAGSIVGPGEFFIIEAPTLDFGLGSSDAARLFDASGTVLIDAYEWVGHATTTYGRCPDGTGGFTTTTTVTKGAPNDCSASLKVNEVESSGGTPGDWIELYNAGAVAIDLSGYMVKDNDDSRMATIPPGTMILPGEFYVIEEPVIDFGLGSGDAARIFNTDGALVDSYEWNSHAPVTYGRCPDGTGDFAATTVSTKGAANICTPVGPTLPNWPGAPAVQTADVNGQFSSNLSGLVYEAASGTAPAVLWGAVNGPGSLFRMILTGGNWVPDPMNDWSAGKALRYTDNSGDVDAEGVTIAGTSAGGIYIAAERNNSASGASRISVLRYDPAQAGTALQATHEWNLTADLPAVAANAGAEAISWIPDSVLVNRQFVDEATNAPYDPASYPDHAGGLFFVGVEANGTVYAYVLNHTTSSFTRVATIATGLPGVMGLEFDAATNYLWTLCDDGCGGRAGILEIDTGASSPTRGQFIGPRLFERPTGLPNVNNEGFAFTSDALCVAGQKPVFWADDNATGGHALRSGMMQCGEIVTLAAPRLWRSR